MFTGAAENENVFEIFCPKKNKKQTCIPTMNRFELAETES